MKKNKNKKMVLTSFVLVAAIVVIGISLTYAYFSMRFTGTASYDNNQAAKLDISSTLTSATAINETKMNLVEVADIERVAKKVNFSVTNESTSNVNAKYIIKLVDFAITKNLSSQYFKWKLVVNPGTTGQQVLTGNFLDTTIAPEGTTDTTEATGLTKVLISDENALPLNINATDNLVFYIWLENDSLVNQIYLTNGSFRAKLALEAYPVKP